MKRVGELQQMGSVAIASPPHDRETSAFGITLDYWYYTPSCAGMSTPAQRVVVSGSTEKEKRVGYGESGGETVWHRVYTPHDGTNELFARSVVDYTPSHTQLSNPNCGILYRDGGAGSNPIERCCVSVPTGGW